ncbi:uncharacterized protein LOC112029357 isoform X2 [Quercus suber]|uniref:uncharacterized protein LOC112029357 isoform X2 n=1 Tax=Quercus suber TaxID=58331 RepID=UPI0032DE2CD8
MNPLKQMKNRDRQRDKFQGSHHRHSIGTVSGEGPLKGSKREEQEKKIANTEGAGYERLQLNFEINKEDRRVFLDVAPMKYLQPTIQMLSGTEFVVCMFKETQAWENQIFNFIGCGTKY